MGRRSARSHETTESTKRDRNHGRQSRSDRSRTTRAEAQHRYGLDVEEDADLLRLRRLEEQFGRRQLRAWQQEGIPLQAMGDADAIGRYRERTDTPVPWNVEEANERSVHRSGRATTAASHRAGETRVPDAVRDVIASPGQSLDASIQRAMEERMGDSLGDVRIHTGPRAAQACEDVNARAFTVGNHVAFNRGEYDPGSPEGQHVLAHELAHVRQRTGGTLSMLPQEELQLEIDADPELEREAEETAQRVMQGEELGIQELLDATIHVQRLNDQRPTGEPMEKWAASFDFDRFVEKYLQENTDVTTVDAKAARHKINPVTDEQLTSGLRREVDSLPERDPNATFEDLTTNVAIAKVMVNDSSFWVAAASGYRLFNEEDENNPLIPGPKKPQREIDHRDFDKDHLSNRRMWCTEPKILEHVTNEFQNDADGEILLYTEQKPCIEACQAFIEEFRKHFSDVDLNVSYTFTEGDR